MSAAIVYQEIQQLLDRHLDEKVDSSTRKRIALLVLGMIRGKSAVPAQVAEAIRTLGLCHAKVESIERRIRRIENDPEITASLCLHPLARAYLALSQAEPLFIALDPTTKEDQLVMVAINVYYRGRTLPIAWTLWPGNTPLEGERFWARIKNLLRVMAEILPTNRPVVYLADRAFGAPAFIDLVVEQGWHYVLRVQGQTRYQDAQGKEYPVSSLVRKPGGRTLKRGKLFKKKGWREASVVVHWQRRYKEPLAVVSDLSPCYELLSWYRRRFPIESTFRDYKSYGWKWEQVQVTDLEHLERRLVNMALATWITTMAGAQVADELRERLTHQQEGPKSRLPWEARRSLFHLGRQRLQERLGGTGGVPCCWTLPHWEQYHWYNEVKSLLSPSPQARCASMPELLAA